MHVLDERLGVLLGNLCRGTAFLVCLLDDLVIDVGNIRNVHDLEAAPLKIAPDHVK